MKPPNPDVFLQRVLSKPVPLKSRGFGPRLAEEYNLVGDTKAPAMKLTQEQLNWAVSQRVKR